MLSAIYHSEDSTPKSVSCGIRGSFLNFEYVDDFGQSHHLSWKSGDVEEMIGSNGMRKISHKANLRLSLQFPSQDFTELDQWMSKRRVSISDKKVGFASRGLLVLAFLAFLSVFPVLYFIVLPRLAESAAEKMPVEYELEMGKLMSQQILRSSIELKSKSAYADSLAHCFRVKTRIPIRIYVIENEELNAFALPGGYIFVHSAMIDACENSEEFAAVLGHEIGHVELMHTTKSFMRSIINGIILSFVFSDYGGISSTAIENADKLKELNYSRELETEADAYSITQLKRASINPKGMIALFEIFEEKEEESSLRPPEFLSSHPLTKNRISHAKKLIGKYTGTVRNAEVDRLFNKLK